MKASTIIWASIRNIGNSQDTGETFNGTLSESIHWLAVRLAAMSMAGRIVIGLGRTKEDSLRGIDVKNSGKAALTDDLQIMLDSVFATSDNDDSKSSFALAIDGDDYES